MTTTTVATTEAPRRDRNAPGRLAKRVLEPDRHAISGRLQRQRPQTARHLHACWPPSRNRGDAMVSVVNALFSLPFIFFSMTGGFLADRYSKRTVMTGVKIFEIGIMTFRARRPHARQSRHANRQRVPDGRAQRDFRPSKYGFAAGIVSREKTFLGQRHSRTRHLHRDHHRHDARAAFCSILSAGDIFSGLRVDRPGGVRPHDQLSGIAKICRPQSRQEIQSKSARRSHFATWNHSKRLRPLARPDWKRLLHLFRNDRDAKSRHPAATHVCHLSATRPLFRSWPSASASGLAVSPRDICRAKKSNNRASSPGSVGDDHHRGAARISFDSRFARCWLAHWVAALGFFGGFSSCRFRRCCNDGHTRRTKAAYWRRRKSNFDLLACLRPPAFMCCCEKSVLASNRVFLAARS